MAAARKRFIANVFVLTGLVLGTVAGGLWFYLLWHTTDAGASLRTAINAFGAGLLGTFNLVAAVVWAFSYLAERIDPPERCRRVERLEPIRS